MALATTIETKSAKKTLEALSFKVQKEPAFTKDGKKIPGMVVVREDTRTPLSWVGDSYGLVPHHVVLEPLIEALGDDFELKHTIIEREGRRVRVDFMGKEELSVVRGDKLRFKGSFINSLDRTQSLKFHGGAFRLLCSNGMGVFLDGYSLNISEAHTKNLGATVAAIDFKKALGSVLTGFKEAVKMLQPLSEKKVDDKKAAELTEKFMGHKAAQEILSLWTTGRGVNGEKTAWNLLNGASQYMTDAEPNALLPVAASIRTYKKTTDMLHALIVLK